MGEMSDMCFMAGWNQMCDYGDEPGNHVRYRDYYYRPYRPWISKEKWIELQRGRPEDAFKDEDYD